MRIKFKRTENGFDGRFYPFGYPPFTMRDGAVKDVPIAIGEKLLSEFKENLTADVLVEEVTEKKVVTPVEEPTTAENVEVVTPPVEAVTEKKKVVFIKKMPETYQKMREVAKELDYDGKNGFAQSVITAFLQERGYK